MSKNNYDIHKRIFEYVIKDGSEIVAIVSTIIKRTSDKK